MSPEPTELVVVTGASSGIGRATAQRLATDGFHVLATVRNRDDAAKLAARNIEPVIVDITDADALRTPADRVGRDEHGGPCGLWSTTRG